MFEAQLIDFKGEMAIAIYMRDMTNFVKTKRQKKQIERLKERQGQVNLTPYKAKKISLPLDQRSERPSSEVFKLIKRPIGSKTQQSIVRQS